MLKATKFSVDVHSFIHQTFTEFLDHTRHSQRGQGREKTVDSGALLPESNLTNTYYLGDLGQVTSLNCPFAADNDASCRASYRLHNGVRYTQYIAPTIILPVFIYSVHLPLFLEISHQR